MKVMNAWEAARVVRKHTMINIRAENIAEHSWGVVHIIWCVWPSAPTRIIKAAQYHDIGEFATGDLPAHVKWANDEVRQTTDRLAADGARQCLPECHHDCLDMSEVEWALIEICDRAEFVFSTYYEVMMGNKHVVKPLIRSWDKIHKLWGEHGSNLAEMHPEISPGISRLMTEVNELRWKVGESI